MLSDLTLSFPFYIILVFAEFFFPVHLRANYIVLKVSALKCNGTVCSLSWHSKKRNNVYLRPVYEEIMDTNCYIYVPFHIHQGLHNPICLIPMKATRKDYAWWQIIIMFNKGLNGNFCTAVLGYPLFSDTIICEFGTTTVTPIQKCIIFAALCWSDLLLPGIASVPLV